MVSDFNPYEAPEAPIFQEVPTVEPIRRPIGTYVATALCMVGSAFPLTMVFASLMSSTQDLLMSQRGLFLMTMAGCGVAFLVAASSFWRRRDFRGVVSVLVGLGLFASIFLVASFVRMTSAPR